MVDVRKEGVILESTGREFENQAVLNPTVLRKGEVVHMFYRAVREGNNSTIGYCKLDGPMNVVERLDKPVLEPEHDYEKKGLEDPRIVELDGTYYLFYTAYDGKNALAAYAESKDLVSFEKKGVVSPQMSYDEAEDFFRRSRLKLKEKYFFFESYYKDVMGDDVLLWEKDAFIFPKRINGRMAFMHRILPDIQIAYADDLGQLTNGYWRDYLSHLSENLLLRSKYWYESRNIGGGAVPVETSEGWLLIYHAVEDADEGKVYHASAALLDREDPQKVIGRLSHPLFSPTEDYEKTGDVNNVVFPSGAAVFDDRLYVYYGAADKRIAVASVDLDELLEELISGGSTKDVIAGIGEVAGQILHEGSDKPVSLKRLSDHLSKDDKLVLMAIGWLAREGRIDYIGLGDDVKVKANE